MAFSRIMCVAALGLTLGLTTPVRAETLGQALSSAYNSSGLLEQNRALLRATDEDYAQAVATMRPVITWALQATTTYPKIPLSDIWSGTLQIMGDLTLYDFGQTDRRIKAQEEAVLATREGLRAVEGQVLMRAVQAFMNVRRQAETVAVRRSNVNVLTEQRRAAQDRFDVGELTRSEVALAEARLAAAQAMLAAAEGALAQARAEYLAAVGHEPGAVSDAPKAPVPATPIAAMALAHEGHPSITGAQHNAAAAAIAIEMAQNAAAPRVALQAGAGVDFNNNRAAQLGLSVGGPIYSGGAIDSRERQAVARHEAAMAGLHLAVAGVNQQIANAYAMQSVSAAGRVASEQQVRAAQVALEGLKEQADLGAATTLDVLNAEQELLNAQVSLISAQVDEVIASYNILLATGLLNAEHLGLAVQIYDPKAHFDMVRNAPITPSAQGAALDRLLQSIAGGAGN